MFTRTLSPFLMLNGPEATGTSTPPVPAPPSSETPPVPAAPAAPAAPVPEAPAASTAEPEAPKSPPWGSDEEFDAQRAWTLLQNKDADLAREKAKRDAAVQTARQEAEQKAREEAYREFGKTLGIVKDDEAPTVEGLSQALQDKDATLTTTQAENQALRIENAALRHADALGADASILLRLEDVKTALAALDPAADNYASEVERTVKEAVEANPFVRKVQVATKSSNGDPAPAGGTPAPTDDVESFRAAYRKERGLND